MAYSQYIKRALQGGNTVKENAERGLNTNAAISQPSNDFWKSRSVSQVASMADDTNKIAELGAKGVAKLTSYAEPVEKFLSKASGPMLSKAAVGAQLATMANEAIGIYKDPKTLEHYRDEMEHQAAAGRVLEGFEHPVTAITSAGQASAEAVQSWLGAMQSASQAAKMESNFKARNGYLPPS